MNKTTEALKLAEEALTEVTIGAFTRDRLDYHKALAAIREALAEQEKQEPAAITVMANGLQYGIMFLDEVPVGTKLYAAPVSVEAAVLAEREACAKVCDEHGFYGAAQAAAIRARGEK